MTVTSVAGETLDFLALLSREARETLLASSTPADFPAGSVLYRPGDGERVLIVTSGLIRVYFQDVEGRQSTVIFAGSGSLLGAINVLGLVPDLFAQAVVVSATIGLDPQAFRRLIYTDLGTATAIATYLSWRLRKTIQLVGLRTLGTMRQRVAFDLLERASRTAHAGLLQVEASHAELADSIGSSREVASRTLAAFKAEGIVATRRGTVEILDLERLMTIVRDFVT